MQANLFWGIIFGLLSALTYSIVNLIDKFIVSKKIKKPLSYTILVGIIHLSIGILLFLSFGEKNLATKDWIICAILGIIYGFSLILYFVLFSKEDVSNIIAVNFSYPIVVAFLAYFILKENIGFGGYLAMGIILLGVFFISNRMKQMKSKAPIVLLVLMILTTGIYEFLIKIGVTKVNEVTALSLNGIFAGITVLFMLFKKEIRIGLKGELKNFKIALFNEGLTFGGLIFLFLGMARAPATIVATITCLQPAIVFIGEMAILQNLKDVVKDKKIRYKLLGISLIILGLVLLIVTTNLI